MNLNTFVDGTTADPTPLNQNFATINERVEDLIQSTESDNGGVTLNGTLRVQWGWQRVTGGSAVVTYPLPFNTQCFGVVATSSTDGVYVFNTKLVNPTTFNVELSSPLTADIFYIAIGY